MAFSKQEVERAMGVCGSSSRLTWKDAELPFFRMLDDVDEIECEQGQYRICRLAWASRKNYILMSFLVQAEPEPHEIDIPGERPEPFQPYIIEMARFDHLEDAMALANSQAGTILH